MSAAVAPLRAILAAFNEGPRSVADVSRLTGLPDDVTRAGVEHLVRTGRIEARRMTAGCPSGGCAGCAMAEVDGPCHAEPVFTGPRSRAALIQLSLVPAVA